MALMSGNPELLEDPPLYSTETEAIKVAADNGYRLRRGTDGPWLRFGSTTAPCDVFIAYSYSGQWWLSIEHTGVAHELGGTSLAGPGIHTLSFDSLYEMHRTLDRVYHLSISLPSAPLSAFEQATEGLLRSTEAQRMVIMRVGQDIFRAALMDYWKGRCPLTGITDPALLRASHIVPWAECTTDEMRLNVYNGILLSPLWDAAFDAGLISFTADGTVLTSPTLSVEAARALQLEMRPRLQSLTPNHELMLQNHRTRHRFS
jgi:hypothetical protein